MRKIVLAAFTALTLASGVPHAQADTPLARIGISNAMPGNSMPGNAMPGSFADLVENLLPAVVNISSTQKIKMPSVADDGDPDGGDGLRPGMPAIPGMPALPPGSPLEELFNQFMLRPGQQMPLSPAASLGSGFIIDADKGYVITNNHVVEDADDVRVILQDDTSLPATVVGRDEKVDIAVLQVKTTKKLTAVKFGDSSRQRVGDWVVAIGNPFGLGGTVTAGIVSAESRNINAGPYDDFIQTDASINRGNSGGPMFNTDGEVIGINTAIFSPTGGSVGIGFALPSNLARPVIDQIIKYGHTRRGWIGVGIQNVTDDIAESLSLPAAKGALIVSVKPGGPAGSAGLKRGDVILEFNGKDITAMRGLPRAVAETEIGKKTTIGYWREGKRQTTAITIGDMEKEEKSDSLTEDRDTGSIDPAPRESVRIAASGMTLRDIDPDDRAAYNIPSDVRGALVVRVAPDSEAAEKGLTPGDVIVEINKQAVNTAAKAPVLFADAAKEGRDSVLLLINRAGDVRFLALKSKPADDPKK